MLRSPLSYPLWCSLNFLLLLSLHFHFCVFPSFFLLTFSSVFSFITSSRLLSPLYIFRCFFPWLLPYFPFYLFFLYSFFSLPFIYPLQPFPVVFSCPSNVLPFLFHYITFLLYFFSYIPHLFLFSLSCAHYKALFFFYPLLTLFLSSLYPLFRCLCHPIILYLFHYTTSIPLICSPPFSSVLVSSPSTFLISLASGLSFVSLSQLIFPPPPLRPLLHLTFLSPSAV